jgi:hypothetical protein
LGLPVDIYAFGSTVLEVEEKSSLSKNQYLHIMPSAQNQHRHQKQQLTISFPFTTERYDLKGIYQLSERHIKL